ncbi:abortive infection family protein, partial [Pseudomonas aeruginosa]
MADLSGSDRRKLEKLLGMGGGYVLNFSDRTFGDFFDEHRVEIDAERYRARGMSKANRMRTHWE